MTGNLSIILDPKSPPPPSAAAITTATVDRSTGQQSLEGAEVGTAITDALPVPPQFNPGSKPNNPFMLN